MPSFLNKATRQAGTFSAQFKAPDLSMHSKITLQTDSDIADLQDEFREMTFTIYKSDDAVSWVKVAGFGYKGYVETRKDQQQPGLVLNPQRLSGKWVRVELTINKPWKLGLQYTVV